MWPRFEDSTDKFGNFFRINQKQFFAALDVESN